MLWFNFILVLNFIFLCFKLIIIHYHTQKQNKIKFKPRIKLNHNIYIYLLARVQRKSFLQCLAFGQAEASINLLAQTSFQLAPKAFWRAELISQFFYYSNSSKNITCMLGKLKTEFTSLIAKSTNPGLLDTTFFARYWLLKWRNCQKTGKIQMLGDKTIIEKWQFWRQEMKGKNESPE